MAVDRRTFIAGSTGFLAASQFGTNAVVATASPVAPSFPDRSNFEITGSYFNAAYTHPVCRAAADFAAQHYHRRMRLPDRQWATDNSRDQAVAAYASLINAAPSEIAVVGSTLVGENLLGECLALGPAAGVVTDSFHFESSLIMYGQRHRRGMPLTVVPGSGGRIDYDELDRAITPETRLVAVSLVSSATGFMHDLVTVCAIAHRKGALVYADLIQAVGALPIDVKASGVDFACAGTYKWLMSDAGIGFLYVRADRLPLLRRVQLGWRAISKWEPHGLPLASPGPPGGEWTIGDDTISLLETGTTSWGTLAATAGALSYINSLGVDMIASYRRSLVEPLREELSSKGYVPLAPTDAMGPALVLHKPDVGKMLPARLAAAEVHISVYSDRVRISPSVYNDLDGVKKVIAALT